MPSMKEAMRIWDFGYWLKVKYKDADSPEGDFYADMIRDINRRRPPFHQNYNPYMPWVNSYEWIKEHLEEVGACYAAIETFESLWKKYKRACPEGVMRTEERINGL